MSLGTRSLQQLKTKLQSIKGSEQIQEVVFLGGEVGREQTGAEVQCTRKNPRFVTNCWKIPTTAAKFNMPELVFVFVYIFNAKFHPAGNVLPLTTQFLRDPFDVVYIYIYMDDPERQG